MAGELILIIEDNDKNLKLMRDLLQFNGYRTAEAVTAEKGLEMAQSQRPALILMDIHLPGMDGITAFRHLKADPVTQTIPVMAVTASATSLDQEQILTAGFDAYETKPIHIRDFPQSIRKVLDSQSRSG
jgi:two-component system, cell cycle response regulator DivK